MELQLFFVLGVYLYFAKDEIVKQVIDYNPLLLSVMTWLAVAFKFLRYSEEN